MEPITIAATTITAVKGLIEIYQKLSGDDAGAARYRDQAAAAEAALPVADALLKLGQEISCKLTDLFFRDELANALEAAKHNPAMRKPGASGAAALALALALLLPLAGCHQRSRALALPQTEETFAGYSITWPADASTDPAAYDTVQQGGRMITTTPRQP